MFGIVFSIKDNLKIKRLLNYQNFTDTIERFHEEALFIDIAVTLPNKEVVILPF